IISADSHDCLYFPLDSYDLHPDLHSFPTRRSSDLCCSGRSAVRSTSLSRRPSPRVRTPKNAQAGRGRARRMTPGHGEDTPLQERSEEHTSELQSRENLVCRLLLEKKKKKHHRSNRV